MCPGHPDVHLLGWLQPRVAVLCNFLCKLEALTLCPGHPDVHLLEWLQPRVAVFFLHLEMGFKQSAHKVCNPYSIEERYLYFFVDVPHLLKTVRNCWSNSFGHSYSRALWVSKFHFKNS